MVQALQAKAIFDCHGDEESELTFLEGDILTDGTLGTDTCYNQTPVQQQLPPQLPSRTPPATKAIGVTPVVEASKRQLPARQTQPSGTKPVPPIDALANTTNRVGPVAGATKVGLPGLGSRSMYGAPRDSGASSPDTQGSDFGRAMSGPPALPKRSNTMHEASLTQEKAATSGAGLSARDRMAALSMSSQAARSPPSAAPRPALPPRTSTASSVDSGLSPATSKTDTDRKHTYQVPDAAVPVPKLTTFSRPRSARTSKAFSPVDEKNVGPTTPAGAKPIASERQAMSTPPKLPTRNTGPSTPGSAGSNGVAGPVRFSPVAARASASDLPTLPAINRNSQPLPLPSRSALISTVGASPVAKSNLGGLSRSATTGAAGAAQPAHQDVENQSGPLGSAFGVKLNSVGSRATTATAGSYFPASQSAPTIAARPAALAQDDFRPPPLPARSNTIPTSPSAFAPAATLQNSPLSKLHRDAGQRPFSTPIDDASARQDDISAQIQQDHQVAKAVAGHDVKTWNDPASSTSILKDALSWHDNSHTGKKTTSWNARGAAIPPTRLPDVNAAERVGIARDARRRYEELFRFVCKGEYLEGAKVHAIYVRSRLDSPTLAQIWDLVDIDNAGRLNKAQFCMGLYLIDERLGTGLIPLEVSDELWVSVMQ
ncbi:Increased rDNA silencing protein [Linnemannia hyalina]|uniref:Increased rDNA silencing protein n=1 Tax=Linnemannia hyalina TaxID=64524 RepID=A0A9P7XVA4_9FUNG|nr:Increased rDNA silencing protein [Linnemannia hyalina]